MTKIIAEGESKNNLENYIIKITALHHSKALRFAETLTKIIEGNYIKDYEIFKEDALRFITKGNKYTALNDFKRTGIRSGILIKTGKSISLNPSLFSANGKVKQKVIRVNYHLGKKTITNPSLLIENKLHVAVNNNDYINDLLNLVKNSRCVTDYKTAILIQMLDENNIINSRYKTGNFGKQCKENGLINNSLLRIKIETLVNNNIFIRNDDHTLSINSTFIKSKKWFNNFEKNKHTLIITFINSKLEIE